MKNNYCLTIIVLYLFGFLFSGCCVFDKNIDCGGNKDTSNRKVKIRGKTYDFSKVTFMKLDQFIGDTLVGYPAYVEGSSSHNVYVPQIDLNLDDANFKIQGNTISVDLLEKGTVINRNVKGEVVQNVPGQFTGYEMKVVQLKANGKVVATVRNVKVKDFGFDNYVLYDREPTTSQSATADLQQDIVTLNDRLERLQLVIDSLSAAHPDHAAITVNNELDRIRAKLYEIRFRYAQESKPELKTIYFDQQIVLNFDFTITDIEREVNNPANNPTAINNAIFFGTGKYEITQRIESEYVEEFLHEIMERVNKFIEQEKCAPDEIRINLKVTGYADDQNVYEPLKSDLLSSISAPPRKGSANEQLVLNKELSKRRGRNVLEYLQGRILESLNYSGDALFRESEFAGKGKSEYPETVNPGSCPGDCLRRRVTLVSCIVYRKPGAE